MIRLLATIVALVVLTGGVLVLRDATLSTHEPVPADSSLVVVVHARTRGGEAGQTVAEMTEAQLLVCRFEVGSDLEGAPRPLGDDRFEAVLVPALDDTDRRQFRGCLQDWVIDHFRLDVESMTQR